MSGVLAERSYGKPEMTLAMKDEIMRQIRLDHNTRLETWVFLDTVPILDLAAVGIRLCAQFPSEGSRAGRYA